MTITTSAPAGYRIDEFETAAVTDELMRGIAELTWAIEREAMPEDPPRPLESIAARFRTTSPMFKRRQWGAFQGDRLVGRATLVQNFTGSNEHLRDVGLDVHPEHRQRGLGRALFARIVEAIGDEQGILLTGRTRGRAPAGEAFAKRVGAEPKLRMRNSQLDLAAVDRRLMDEWASLDPAGYRLEWIAGDTPDRLMPNVLTAIRTMNTAPREGLDMDDWVMTAEMVRDWERMAHERGQEHLMVLAIDDASGETAAFTQIFWDPREPHVVGQGGTATVPVHRGKGLGKWVKARMLLRVLEDHPEARYIRTDNAGTNAPMLAINTKMGFGFIFEAVIWQMPLADAQKYVHR